MYLKAYDTLAYKLVPPLFYNINCSADSCTCLGVMLSERAYYRLIVCMGKQYGTRDILCIKASGFSKTLQLSARNQLTP